MPMPKWLLALEVRASRIGFAVFEGPTRLLDWGVRSFETGNKTLKSSAADRIATLLAFHRPFAIVLRSRTYNSASQRRVFATIAGSIRAEAKRYSSKLIVLAPRQVQSCFSPSDSRETLRGTFMEITAATEILSERSTCNGSFRCCREWHRVL
jgi:hypothetical protein